MIETCIEYIAKSPTSFHAVAALEEQLKAAGFQPADDAPAGYPSAQGNQQPQESQQPQGPQRYWTRNQSALIAVRLPEKPAQRILITAAHTDSPCFRIRDHAERKGTYTTLSVERYGGAINATWLDRPLSIAGRVMLRTADGVRSQLVDFQKDMAVISNVAIHLNPELNSKPNYSLAKDYFPLFAEGTSEGALKVALAEALSCQEGDILSTDLFLYNNQKGSQWGPDGAFLSAPRLDDLASVAACLEGFLEAENEDSIQILCAFDNEEIGSGTYPGAESDFLPSVLAEIWEELGCGPAEKRRILQQSMMLSCDNAHAVHPNHPELSDGQEAPVLNGGLVLKHSPRYTTTGVSGAILQALCDANDIPLQHYSNRPDKPGGSTLGNLAITKTGMMAADIGIPQLSMHSAYETCGVKDLDALKRAVVAFYQAKLAVDGDGFRV